MDGEYDIFGNMVAPTGGEEASSVGATLSAAPEAAPGAAPGEVVVPVAFRVGDAVEVKEGGKVYRAATIVKCELDIGTLDLLYADGEKECGVPVTLVRPVVEAAAARPPGAALPPGMAPSVAPEAQSAFAAANTGKARRPKKESAAVSTKDASKARQCYELLKGFTDAEQDAALQMLLALDSVRKGV